jgi:outer membrane protein assembly factor BamB
VRLVASFVLLAGCLSAADPTPARPGTDWPGFGGPTGDNVSTEIGLLTAWPADGLRKVWDCPLDIGFAPPSVAGGKLYHFDMTARRDGDQVATSNRVTCRNADTGASLWTFEYPTDFRDNYGYQGTRCCPVIDGDRVYVYGPEGMLLCLTADAGKEVWKLDTRAKYHVQKNHFGVGSAPVVFGDLLLVSVGGSPAGPPVRDLRLARPDGTAIVALDKRTGAVRWAAGDELASYAVPVVATMHGRKVGLLFARGGLLGFDPATGRTHFRFPWRSRELESVNAANPVVAGDTVLVSECYGLGAACLAVKPDLSGVTPVWTDADKDRDERSLACHWNTPIHHDGYVYGCSGRHEGEADLRCVELRTGTVKWAEKGTRRCTLLKVDGHLLSLSERGELRLFRPNPAKYEEVARWQSPDLEYPAWAPPVLSRGRLYVRGKDRLVCYDLAKP